MRKNKLEYHHILRYVILTNVIVKKKIYQSVCSTRMLGRLWGCLWLVKN